MAEFLDIIGTKVLRVFLLAIHSHPYTNGFYPPPPLFKQRWFKTWFVMETLYVYGNLKNFQDYAQKPESEILRS
jgi:hypothetical protein